MRGKSKSNLKKIFESLQKSCRKVYKIIIEKADKGYLLSPCLQIQEAETACQKASQKHKQDKQKELFLCGKY